MRILYGLGNPGDRYANHRHNAGRLLVERYASGAGVELDRSDVGVRFTRCTRHGHDLLLAVPRTYMNHSGRGFRTLLDMREEPSLHHVLVVYDDLDLEVGTLRFRASGGDGGHRGMRSILSEAGTDEVPRLRIGIGRPPEGVEPSEYVLRPFPDGERKKMDEAFDRGCRGIDTWLQDGLRDAMNTCNR